MNEFSSDIDLNLLDFPHIVDQAARYALTQLGEEAIRSLVSPVNWAVDIEAANRFQMETAEASTLIAVSSIWESIASLKSPFACLDQIEKGSVPPPHEIYVVWQWLNSSSLWIEAASNESRCPIWRKSINALKPLESERKNLESLFDEQGAISENASQKLRALFKQERSLRSQLQTQMASMARELLKTGKTNDALVDLRDGRFVLTIKTQFQSEIHGVVHDTSASGQSIYLEPEEVLAGNNQLRSIQNEIRLEISRLLREVCDLISKSLPEIREHVRVIGYWDCLQAKARVGQKYGGKRILVTKDRIFSVSQTAHPGLWWSLDSVNIVRNDLHLTDTFGVLLLTGPNAGGKSVLMKTLGLLAVFARTGFFAPSDKSPTVGFFSKIRVIMGDQQSLMGKLSSFAAFLKNVNDVLQIANASTLVLIDELNSATDPEEGSALARAILENLISKNSLVIGTTHDPKLKALSLSNSKIWNGSLEFDSSSSLPTFTLRLGVTGRSCAFETAKRMGLPNDLIEQAKQYASTAHQEWEAALSKLSHSLSVADSARREAEESRKLWKEKAELFSQEYLSDARSRMRRILEHSQDQIRTTLKKLGDSPTRKSVQSAREETMSVLEETENRVQEIYNFAVPKEKDSPVLQEALNVGDHVRVKKWLTTGIIAAIDTKGVKVKLGGMTVSLGLEEISKVESKSTKKSPARLNVSTQVEAQNVPRTLDIRGKRFEEAMLEVRQYLNEAFFGTDHTLVSIIHGLGTGALREGVRSVLKELPTIKAFQDGDSTSGGPGATVVEFETRSRN